MNPTPDPLADEVAALAARVAALEASPPGHLSGWAYWLKEGIASRRFQAMIAAVLIALSSLVAGAIDGPAFIVAALGIVVAWLTSETVTDVARSRKVDPPPPVVVEVPRPPYSTGAGTRGEYAAIAPYPRYNGPDVPTEAERRRGALPVAPGMWTAGADAPPAERGQP